MNSFNSTLNDGTPMYPPIDPSRVIDTSPQTVFEAARRYVASGLSVIPIASNMSKAPEWRVLPQVWEKQNKRYAPSWRPFQAALATVEDLEKWFLCYSEYTNCQPGIGIVGGKISGELEILDFDQIKLFDAWVQGVEQKAPGLWPRLVRVRTPRPGMHVYFRSKYSGATMHLAMIPDIDESGAEVLDRKTNLPKLRAIIDKKGEGGYCIAPPSPRFCHPQMTEYLMDPQSPGLDQLPTISVHERLILLEVAATFDRSTTTGAASDQKIRGDAGKQL